MDEGSRGSIVVLGGGVAGIAAALEGAQRGFRVVLVERKRWLGGRAYAFADRASGLELDNGQHVIIGAYKNFRRLLRAIKSEQNIDFQENLCIPYREWGPSFGVRESELRALPLPAPLHLGSALLRWGALSWGDKLSLIRPAIEMLGMGDGVLKGSRHDSLGAWLDAFGQSKRVREVFWEPLALATLNGHLDEVGVMGMATVLAAGFGGSRRGAVMGVPRTNLSGLVGRPALVALRAAGVEVLLDETVVGLEPKGAGGRGWDVRLGSGERVEAEHVVSAVEPDVLCKWLPGLLVEGNGLLGVAKGLAYSPIVSAHLLYGRAVRLKHRFIGLLGSRLQWAFDANPHHPGYDGGHISLVISGADEEAALEKVPLEAWIWGEVEKLLPEARVGGVDERRMVIVKEKRATLRLTPEAERRRVGMGKMIEDGLYVAGAWTQTGFPSTLEGAAMSGYAAIESILARTGERVQVVEPLDERDQLLKITENAARMILQTLGGAKARLSGVLGRIS